MSGKNTEILSVGICGLGTVGGGTLALLEQNAALITARAGCPIRVTHVATRTPKPDLCGQVAHTGSDPLAITSDPEVDVVVETMGGYDVAFEVIQRALSNGKHVVTANKALIAERGNELFALASANEVTLAFESAVAGGIPIIKALREGLAANDIEWLAGIINGTGNFILSEMSAKQSEFSEVLQQAQELGYAEADPTFDVEGIDAAHKLTIMSAIAFGIPLQFEKTYTEGISGISPADISFAEELGYRIKHLGIARKTVRGVEMRVHPTLVSNTRLLANVNGVGNAVMVQGNFVGSTLYSGPGAGAEATASAVVADLIDLARDRLAGVKAPVRPALGSTQTGSSLEVLPIEQIEVGYYLKIPVLDKLGVMAKLSAVLQQRGISIEAIIQKESENSETVPVVILTQVVRERELNAALDALAELDEVTGPVTRIRIEPFDGEA
ncbi:MAG: homoserine dehydrogenase [Pseudohongiellaceae bacterium]|nr:homoserine dehydrogenase [Pseudomonadota bacterium]